MTRRDISFDSRQDLTGSKRSRANENDRNISRWCTNESDFPLSSIQRLGSENLGAIILLCGGFLEWKNIVTPCSWRTTRRFERKFSWYQLVYLFFLTVTFAKWTIRSVQLATNLPFDLFKAVLTHCQSIIKIYLLLA